MVEIKKGVNQLAQIREIVFRYRQELGIIPKPGSGFEGSCIAAYGGEMGNLLSQLAHTKEGYGDWCALTHEETRKEFLQQYGLQEP